MMAADQEIMSSSSEWKQVYSHSFPVFKVPDMSSHVFKFLLGLALISDRLPLEVDQGRPEYTLHRLFHVCPG